jgi:hypothetical protein
MLDVSYVNTNLYLVKFVNYFIRLFANERIRLLAAIDREFEESYNQLFNGGAGFVQD